VYAFYQTRWYGLRHLVLRGLQILWHLPANGNSDKNLGNMDLAYLSMNFTLYAQAYAIIHGMAIKEDMTIIPHEHFYCP